MQAPVYLAGHGSEQELELRPDHAADLTPVDGRRHRCFNADVE